jgi:hypothetical protein
MNHDSTISYSHYAWGGAQEIARAKRPSVAETGKVAGSVPSLPVAHRGGQYARRPSSIFRFPARLGVLYVLQKPVNRLSLFMEGTASRARIRRQQTSRYNGAVAPSGDINDFALLQAEAAAARLWAFGSAPFPLANGAIIQGHIEQAVTDTAIGFAIHVRRLLDNRGLRTEFELDEPFWEWSPAGGLTKVQRLRDALNRIVHATDFTVGFERLPDGTAKIAGGAISVIYLRTKTNQRVEALIDVFALASCFFHQVLPALRPPSATTLEVH